MLLDTIGKRLKAERTKLNMTQYQVAEMVGITEQTYHGQETDKRAPLVPQLILYAKTFPGLNLHWLITGSDYADDD